MPPVETDDDRASFVVDFGSVVTWRAAVFPAIFDRPTTMVVGISEVDIADRYPTICFPESSLPPGAVEGDAVSVVDDFGTYAFRVGLIRPDGSGYVSVDLKT